ncbi:hypothetical protein K443DRAFT_639091 [Laccaria amethystina LaAM-08-1]|uniref:Uncharacterized protein n=1 Tax=Laccaria amethystina LaAM-08-1 TaxID=1095629 RepID=A0A0C9WTH2_9AGAR|nr:hypothetical protein K443DRAFT_639091 [Laccaria amethystina LaAM-08-1]
MVATTSSALRAPLATCTTAGTTPSSNVSALFLAMASQHSWDQGATDITHMRRYQDVNHGCPVINFALSTDVANHTHQEHDIDQSPTFSLSSRPSCTESSIVSALKGSKTKNIVSRRPADVFRSFIQRSIQLSRTRHAAVFGPKTNLIFSSFCHQRAIWRRLVAPLVCSLGRTHWQL